MVADRIPGVRTAARSLLTGFAEFLRLFRNDSEAKPIRNGMITLKGYKSLFGCQANQGGMHKFRIINETSNVMHFYLKILRTCRTLKFLIYIICFICSQF